MTRYILRDTRTYKRIIVCDAHLTAMPAVNGERVVAEQAHPEAQCDICNIALDAVRNGVQAYLRASFD